MKPILSAIISVLLVMTAFSADEAVKKPSAEQKKLEILVGKWRYDETQSESPFGKAGQTVFTSVIKPVQNGFFLEESGKAKGSSYNYGTLYFWDSAAATYKTFFWDSDGFVSLNTSTFDGTVLSSTHTRTVNGKTYRFRNISTLSADGKSMSYTDEYEDGGTWKMNFQGTGKKIGLVK